MKKTHKLCCNWDCDKYPSSADKCFNSEFKCLWFEIARKVETDKNKDSNALENNVI